MVHLLVDYSPKAEFRARGLSIADFGFRNADFFKKAFGFRNPHSAIRNHLCWFTLSFIDHSCNMASIDLHSHLVRDFDGDFVIFDAGDFAVDSSVG